MIKGYFSCENDYLICGDCVIKNPIKNNDVVETDAVFVCIDCENVIGSKSEGIKMKEYKVDSFLYLPKGTSEDKVYKILNNNLINYSINSIEDRGHEVAVDFDVIVENISEEQVEKWFLNAMFDYDVDNYTIKEL